jgi:hypothetical protein
VPSWLGVIEPLDDDHCILTIGGDTYDMIAAMILHAGVEFTLLDPPELAQSIRQIAARLLDGIGGSPQAAMLR